MIAIHLTAAALSLLLGALVLARRKGTASHKGFMIGTFLGLTGAGLGALAPGRTLYLFFFA